MGSFLGSSSLIHEDPHQIPTSRLTTLPHQVHVIPQHQSWQLCRRPCPLDVPNAQPRVYRPGGRERLMEHGCKSEQLQSNSVGSLYVAKQSQALYT